MDLVIGATGILGGMITRLLLQRGRAVRILVRPTANFQALVDLGAEPVLGDLKQPESLRAALAGMETVLTTATAAQRGGEDTPESVDHRGNLALIDAAHQAGIRQFIFVSAYGANPQHPEPILAAKGVVEERLLRSGLTYTILRPTAFSEVWPPLVVGLPILQGQPVTLVGAGSHRHAFISMQDVAAYAVACVQASDALNQSFSLSGPEALSWKDVVTLYEHILDSVAQVRFVEADAPLPLLPKALWGMMRGFETYESWVDMRELSRRFQIKPTYLATVIRQSLHSPARLH